MHEVLQTQIIINSKKKNTKHLSAYNNKMATIRNILKEGEKKTMLVFKKTNSETLR